MTTTPSSVYQHIAVDKDNADYLAQEVKAIFEFDPTSCKKESDGKYRIEWSVCEHDFIKLKWFVRGLHLGFLRWKGMWWLPKNKTA